MQQALDAHPATRAPAEPLVPAVSRAVLLLERLARQRRPMSASLLAAELSLPRSSVHGLCSTLLHHGLLRRQGAGGFVINSGYNGALPSAVLNIIWAAMGLFTLWSVWRARQVARAAVP